MALTSKCCILLPGGSAAAIPLMQNLLDVAAKTGVRVNFTVSCWKIVVGMALSEASIIVSLRGVRDCSVCICTPSGLYHGVSHAFMP
jgi:hypothetical protein